MNSSNRLVAQRYALAYDSLSSTNQEAMQRARLLREAVAALSAHDEVMQSPRVTLQAKKEAVRAAFSSEKQTAHFIELLLEAKRYYLLPEISRRVGELLDKRLGIIRARVYAAQTLTQAQQEQTQAVLSKRYGGNVKAVFTTSPDLLGGLKIVCQGEQIDGSLQHKLAKLQEELTK